MSDLSKDSEGAVRGREGPGRPSAKAVGISWRRKKAPEKNITQVVFDRNGYLYHGVVKALADGAREGGLKF